MSLHLPASTATLFHGRRREWQIAQPAAGASLLTDWPPLIGQLLYRRGIHTNQQALDFLNPPTTAFCDPLLLPDIGNALERLTMARRLGQGVAVYGDFDADGVTGTALLTKALRRFGLNVVAYIPHRVTEGHGLNEGAIRHLRDQSVQLLVTVDCGVTDTDVIRQAKALGVDTIVTDHHLTGTELPEAVAIINPHAPHSKYPFEHLTGAGMSLKLAQGLLEPEHGPAWADGLMELAAIGTVTDMAPLLGENRYIVTKGIQQMQQTRSLGLLALMKAAGIQASRMEVTDIGFGIGPRLNAAGRLDRADIAYELLMADDPDRAEELAAGLDTHNGQRQALTQEALDAARQLLPPSLPAVIVVGSPSFNPGVIGLVAGKLAEEHGVPAVVYAQQGDQVMASCRSGPGFHWADALKACGELLIRHGGHAQAAGFACSIDALPVLMSKLEAIAGERQEDGLRRMRTIEAEATPANLMGATFQAMRRMEPFGIGNPVPLFLMRGAQVERAATMGSGEQHFRLTVRDGGALWDAVAFRQEWTAGTSYVDLVYSLAVDRWNGSERLRLQVEDYAPSQ